MSLQKILEFGEIRIGQLGRRSDHTLKPLHITNPRLIRGKTYVFPLLLSHSDAIILKSNHHITNVLKQKSGTQLFFFLHMQYCWLRTTDSYAVVRIILRDWTWYRSGLDHGSYKWKLAKRRVTIAELTICLLPLLLFHFSQIRARPAA